MRACVPGEEVDDLVLSQRVPIGEGQKQAAIFLRRGIVNGAPLLCIWVEVTSSVGSPLLHCLLITHLCLPLSFSVCCAVSVDCKKRKKKKKKKRKKKATVWLEKGSEAVCC